MKILKLIQNEVGKLGLNLEMLFRAANSKNEDFINTEEFKIFLQRLKIKLKPSQISRFIYLLDEDLTGQITKNDYQSTLLSFKINVEEETFELARIMKKKVLSKFMKAIANFQEDLQVVFDGKIISFKEFLSFLDNSLSDLFNEKEKQFLMNHFDPKSQGYIEKQIFFREMRQIKKKIQFEDIEDEEGMETVLQNLKSNKQNLKKNENYIFSLFLKKFEKFNKNLKNFTDILGLYILDNRSIYKSNINSISLEDFKQFLEKNFLIVLGQDLINEVINHLFEQNIQFKSNYEKEKLQKQNKFSLVDFDLIEFKNKLIDFSKSCEDTSKLLFVLAAIKLDELDISTENYLKKYGYNIKRKVDFSEFFILAQKIIFANFKEITKLHQKYDFQNEGYFSLQGLIEDINAYRGENIKIGKKDILTEDANFEKITKKVKKINRNFLNDFIICLSNQQYSINKPFDSEKIKHILQKCLDNKLSEIEENVLINYIDINKNNSVELFEIVEFLASYFGNEEDMVEIYSKLIGNYLDQQNMMTRKFFRDYNLFDDSKVNERWFCKKLNVIFGIIESHTKIIFKYLNKKNEKEILFGEFIEKLEENRKQKNDQRVEQKELKNILSNESVQDKENIQKRDGKTKKGSTQKNQQKEQIKKDPELRKALNDVKMNLKKIIESNSLELENMNYQILNNESQSYNMLQLKIQLSQILNKNETRIMLTYFKQCDLNKNGVINLKEWQKFSKTLGIKQPKQKKKRVQINIKTDEEFLAFIRKECEEEKIIDKQIMYEISELENNQISLIYLKKYLKRTFPDQDLTSLLALMSYLDDSKNGFVKFSDFKFLLVMIDANGKENNLDVKIFRKYFLHHEKILKYSKDEMGNLNLLQFLRRIVKYLNDEEETNFATYINKKWNEKKTFIITYEEFLTEIEVEQDIKKHYWQLEKNKNVINSLNKLRRSLRQYENEQDPIMKCLKSIDMSERQMLMKIFEIEEFDQKEKMEFLNFVLFCDWREMEQFQENLKSIGIKAKKMYQQKFVKSSSLKEDHFDLVSLGIQKLMKDISNKPPNFLGKHMKAFMSEQNEQMNFLKFKTFLKKISPKIKEDEMLKIFQSLDTNNNHNICKNELKEFIDSNFKIYMRSEFFKKSKYSRSVEESQKTITMSQIEQKITNELNNFKIERKHYFKNNKTIFTNIIAAFKYASEQAKLVSQHNKKYIDPEFGPNEEDQFGQKSIYYDEVIPGYIEPENCVWLRPEEISLKEPPVFLHNGAESNDVNQGYLGDCWFISALSIIATNDEYLYHDLDSEEIKGQDISDELACKLIQGIYPKIFHFLGKFGIYVLKFFKDYQWIYVMIDDRLACYGGNLENPELVFAKCHNKSEFWVPIIEKAYAKIHGNYFALTGGQIDDGLVDMTGNVSEKLKILNMKNKFNAKTFKSKEQLWQKLNNDITNKSMMGCSIRKTQKSHGEGKVYNQEGEFLGLYSGHAYGILDMIDLGTEKIMRIRNPWGSDNPIEWNGAWSDNSTELLKNLQQINKKIQSKWSHEAELITKEAKDGTFFMSYVDFTSIWHNISICKKFSSEYEGLRFFNEWTEDNSGGTPYTNDPIQFQKYLDNPQYILTLKQKTHLFISLGQEDGRIKSRGQENFPYSSHTFPLSICVFTLDDGSTSLPCFDGNKLKTPPFIKLNRDVQIDCELDEGKYVIVPATKDIGQFGNFVLNVYYNCGNNKMDIFEFKGQKRGEVILEESEGIEKFEDYFKRLLKEIILQNKQFQQIKLTNYKMLEIKKFIEFIFAVFLGWFFFFLSQEGGEIVYTILHTVSYMSTYLAIRNFVISQKKYFDRIYYFQLVMLKLTMDVIVMIVYYKITNPVQMILSLRTSFLGIFVFVVFDNISNVTQKFTYLFARWSNTKFFYDFMIGFKPQKDPLSLFYITMEIQYFGFSIIFLFWAVEFYQRGWIKLKHKLFHFGILYIMEVMFYLLDYYFINFYKEMLIQALMISFVVNFHFYYRNVVYADTYFIIYETKLTLMEKEIQEKQKRRKMRKLKKNKQLKEIQQSLQHIAVPNQSEISFQLQIILLLQLKFSQPIFLTTKKTPENISIFKHK